MGKPVKALLFLSISGVLLYFALAGLNWPEFFKAFQGMRASWTLVCVIFLVAALLVRGYRWSLLLQHRVTGSFFTAYVGEAVGDVGNTFLPGRAGEAMRALYVAKRLRIPVSFILGTETMERVSDAIFASLLAFIMILVVPDIPRWLFGAAVILFVLGTAALLLMAFLPLLRPLHSKIMNRTAITRRVASFVGKISNEIWLGSQALFANRRRTTIYIMLTMAYWILDAIAILYLGKSFGAPLKFQNALLLLSALGLASAVPSTPGYIGVYQFVAVSVLVPLGISHVNALAIILVYQIGTILIQLLSGGLIGSVLIVDGWRRRSDSLST